MRARILACAGLIWIGACVYPAYHVADDGGAAGATGPGSAGAGGRGGGTAGAAGTAGRGGTTAGSGPGGAVAGAAGGGAAGATGGGGVGGSSGGAGGGSAGRGGTTGAAGAGGGSAGRGGTTGTAGSSAGAGGGSGGRGGTSGTGGGAAGRGGTTGAAGSTAGTGGGSGGRGGTSGTGGSAGTGTGGASTAAPDWLGAMTVVYQFDMAPDKLGAEAHGNETLHMEEDSAGSLLPRLDMTTAIEGNSAYLPGTVAAPAYFRSRSGASLPSDFATASGTSFTMGGWFRIDPTLNDNLQYLINDEGPGAYDGGFVFYLDQRLGSFSTRAALTYCRIGTSEVGFNYNEAETANDVGPDSVVGNRWAHLVCRYDANLNQLSLFVAGVREARQPTTHPIKTGPGPFIVGCDVSFCAFVGNVDEVFFTRSALPDVDVARIYACGIDGSRCRCNGQSYVSCGFAMSGGCGSTLPACNAGP